MKSVSDTLRRIPELDGIRAIAVLMVLIYHAIFDAFPHSRWDGLFYGIWKVAQGGWLGVHLFFVLSGLLITTILLNSKTEHDYYKRFYFRRILRIFPAYFATLFVIYLITRDLAFLGFSSVFLSNIMGHFGLVMVYPVVWSLCVEEHFYLLWPLLTKKLTHRGLWNVSICIILISPLLRFVAERFQFVQCYQSWYCFDGLAWGAVLALYLSGSSRSEAEHRRTAAILFTLGVVLLSVGTPFGVMSRRNLFGQTFMMSFLYFCIAGIILFARFSRNHLVGKLLRFSFLQWVGKISYSLYLLHGLTVVLWEKVLVSTVVERGYLGSDLFVIYNVRFLFILVSSLLLASLSYRFIELPFLKLKEKNASKQVSPTPRRVASDLAA